MRVWQSGDPAPCPRGRAEAEPGGAVGSRARGGECGRVTDPRREGSGREGAAGPGGSPGLCAPSRQAMFRGVLNTTFPSLFPPSTPPRGASQGFLSLTLCLSPLYSQSAVPPLLLLPDPRDLPVNCPHKAPQRNGIAKFPKCVFLLRELDTFSLPTQLI